MLLSAFSSTGCSFKVTSGLKDRLMEAAVSESSSHISQPFSYGWEAACGMVTHTQKIDLHFWSSAASEQYPRCLCGACPPTECELGLRNLEKSAWAVFAQDALVLYPLLQSLARALQLYTWERQLREPKEGQHENLSMPKELLWTGIAYILDLEHRESTQGRSGLLQSVQK